MMCFRKHPLAKKFMGKTGGGSIKISVESFCLTVPKNLEGEPFCAVFQKLSSSEKSYG